MNTIEYPITINEHTINETELYFCGEGTFSRVWCNRQTAFKIPKLEIMNTSFAAVFRDAFFQNLIDNYECTLAFGRWRHHDNIPILCNKPMEPMSISETVVDHDRLITSLVSNMYKINQHGIRHGDVHPHNVCGTSWGGESYFHLIDFDNAVDLTKATMLKHTRPPTICAPEVSQTRDISHSSEIWSLGATVATMCFGRLINPTSRRTCQEIINEAGGMNKNLGQFLKDTLQTNPQKRLDITSLATKYSCISPIRPIAYTEDPNLDWFDISSSFHALINQNIDNKSVFNAQYLNSMIKCVLEAKTVRKMFC
jgi:serine/threonine protein kinase